MLLAFHTLRFLFGNRRDFPRVLLGLLFLCINKLWYEKTIRFHHTTIHVPLYRHCIIVRSQFYRHSIVIISPSYHHYITIISYYIIYIYHIISTMSIVHGLGGHLPCYFSATHSKCQVAAPALQSVSRVLPCRKARSLHLEDCAKAWTTGRFHIFAAWLS